MSRIEDLLRRDFPPPYRLTQHNTTTSDKAWTHAFNPVSNAILQSNALDTFDREMPILSDDRIRLRTTLQGTFYDSQQVMSSEGDVTRIFDQLVSGPVMTAWQNTPRIFERDEVGPMQQTQFAGTIDKAFTYNGHCAAIGERKRPGIITTDWSNNDQDSTNKQRLGRELRGYVPMTL
jgi:hypothetical protein